eukprot:6033380-Lingulodinium_polyedra.AAC.1
MEVAEACSSSASSDPCTALYEIMVMPMEDGTLRQVWQQPVCGAAVKALPSGPSTVSGLAQLSA